MNKHVYESTPWGTGFSYQHHWPNPRAAVGHGHIRNPTEYIKMLTNPEEIRKALNSGFSVTIGNPWTIPAKEQPTMEKPKPCPFCMSADTLTTCIASEDNDERNYFVECKNCAADGPLTESRHEAIQEWNKALRPTIPCPDPLPCPHCKHDGVVVNTVMVPNASTYFFAECAACQMRGPVAYKDKSKAADAWNKLARHWE